MHTARIEELEQKNCKNKEIILDLRCEKEQFSIENRMQKEEIAMLREELHELMQKDIH